MAKKQNVEINGKPLESITIGQVKEHKYSWIITIIIFILFIGIVYYLPELMRLYQNYINGNTTPTNTAPISNIIDAENKTVEEDETEESLYENKYKFQEINEVVFNKNLTFNNITFNDGLLSFSVVNSSASNIDLQTENLYFETYDENNNLLNRIALKSSILGSKSMDLEYQIKSGAIYYEIKQILEDDYTYISLDVDENNTSILTCTKDDEKLVYTFVDDKLKIIEHNLSYLKNNINYDEYYSKLATYVVTYGTTNGISAGISQNSTSLNYRMKIDYNTFNSTISNEYYFAKDTTPRIVNFKIEALLFECV